MPSKKRRSSKRKSKRPLARRRKRHATAPSVFTLTPKKHDPFHALGRLNEAVHALATYPGSIRARLFEAMKSLTPISPEEIPDGDLRRVFIGISDDLRHVEAQGNEGRLVATLRHTEDEDLSKIAGRILDLYQWLDELLLHRR